MLPALLGLIAPVAAIKAVSQLLRAARSLTPQASLSGPPAAEKAAEVSEPKPARPVIFAYDGMSRRTKITELTNGTVTSKKLYFWLGGSIVCERDGLQTGFPITKRFFSNGVVQGTTKLYYATDHLGSVRELVDSTGAVRAEYSYSTYGEQSKQSGDLEADFGYAGLWNHKPSGLYLGVFRAYDPVRKGWVSRDPLGEGSDRTLYTYCFNNPINFVDPTGLDGLPAGWTMSSSGGVNAYSNWNNFANGPRNTVPETSSSSRPSSPGSQASGSNGITGGRPAPVGGGHTHFGEGGTWLANSVFNMYRDGNAASAGDVYSGAEYTAAGVIGVIVFMGGEVLVDDYLLDGLRIRGGNMDLDEFQELVQAEKWVREGERCEKGRRYVSYISRRYRVVVEVLKGGTRKLFNFMPR